MAPIKNFTPISESLMAKLESPPLYEKSENQSPSLYDDSQTQSPSPPLYDESQTQSPSPSLYDESQTESPPAPLILDSPPLFDESIVPEIEFSPLDDGSQPREGSTFLRKRVCESESTVRTPEGMVAKIVSTVPAMKWVVSGPEADLLWEDDADIYLSYNEWKKKYIAKGLLIEYKSTRK